MEQKMMHHAFLVSYCQLSMRILNRLIEHVRVYMENYLQICWSHVFQPEIAGREKAAKSLAALS